MQAVIDQFTTSKLPVLTTFVASSREGVFALERAKKMGIPYGVFEKKDYDTFKERDTAIANAIGEVDLVICAGYLGILTTGIIEKYRGKLINIHPSLLPKFGGKGMFGENVHKAVLSAGENVSGATVHFVDVGIDTGKIILQGEVPVLKTDTPQTLADRVLGVEHKILFQAVKNLLQF